jgi:hypothetical protein
MKEGKEGRKEGWKEEQMREEISLENKIAEQERSLHYMSVFAFYME